VPYKDDAGTSIPVAHQSSGLLFSAPSLFHSSSADNIVKLVRTSSTSAITDSNKHRHHGGITRRQARKAMRQLREARCEGLHCMPRQLLLRQGMPEGTLAYAQTDLLPKRHREGCTPRQLAPSGTLNLLSGTIYDRRDIQDSLGRQSTRNRLHIACRRIQHSSDADHEDRERSQNGPHWITVQGSNCILLKIVRGTTQR
jgi:hypothetical protein